MRWSRRLSRLDTEGQAMVETAIVAPLFIFMMLGLLQLTLILQARSMLKYAAYRAARTGAMHNACKPKMVDSALGALVPVIGWGDSLLRSRDVGEYALSYAKVKFNHYLGMLPIIDLKVCGPLRAWFNDNKTYKNDDEVDFDDPRNLAPAAVPGSPNASSNGRFLRGFEHTKLKVQIRYNHKLIIPFANAIFFRSWAGWKISETVRLSGSWTGVNYRDNKFKFDIGKRTAARDTAMLRVEALENHRFYFPLYAAYAFRMQSNILLDDDDCKPPDTNDCWHYDDGSGSGSP